jgi:Uma2 family endonuclease
MSTAVEEAPPLPIEPSIRQSQGTDPGWTVADLVESLGGIPLHRIRLVPPPGTATEEDVLSLKACELVSGVIVERAMGYFESRLGAVLLYLVEHWLTSNNIGYCNGEGALTRMRLGNVRIPDLSFIRWDRAGDEVPKDPICGISPNLAVEILSPSNTKAEIDRKRDEYFETGVELVWIVDPVRQIIEVWSTSRDCHLIGMTDVLDGGTVLPGLSISVAEWFERARRRAPPAPGV